jgi:voltage-gated potassium channel
MTPIGDGSRVERWLSRSEDRRGLRPRDAARLIVTFWFLAVLLFGILEHLIDRDTFPTVALGMWWALQTVTTVGYGDVVPGTVGGKAIAAFLMLGGLSLLSVVTATITSAFVARAQRQRHGDREEELLRRLAEVSEKLDRLTPGP